VEVWLKSSSKSFRVPVIPAEYTVTGERGDESVDINAIGEVDLAGNRKLRQVSWSCFFPYEYDESYCQYGGLKSPRKCVEIIETMMHAGPVKVIITGTPVKFWARISSFEWGERDGSGDIYYSITLKEHRTISVGSSTVSADESLSAGTSADTTTQRTVPETTETAEVKVNEAGMSASAIARKYTGSASNKDKVKNTDGSELTWFQKMGNTASSKMTVKDARVPKKAEPFGGSTTHTGAGGMTFGGKTGKKFGTTPLGPSTTHKGAGGVTFGGKTGRTF